MSEPILPAMYDVVVAGIGKRPLEGIIGYNAGTFAGVVEAGLPRFKEVEGEIVDGVLKVSIPMLDGKHYTGTLRKTKEEDSVTGTYVGSLRVEDGLVKIKSHPVELQISHPAALSKRSTRFCRKIKDRELDN